jgi:hypothetical protein
MEFNEWLLNEQDYPTAPQVQQQPVTPVQKKWKATKEEIFRYWQSLQPDQPIAVRPIPYEHAGSTYGQDGVRVTGSQEFISTVIARLKEFLNFETPNSKLQLVYRETESKKDPVDPENKTYVFYVQVKERGTGG